MRKWHLSPKSTHRSVGVKIKKEVMCITSFILFCRRELLLLAVEFVRNCQFLTALCTTGSQYATTISGSHSLTETVLVLSLSQRRLECSFHCFVLFYFVLLFLFRRLACSWAP